eukprot:scaffold4833_cov233-Amphora_coffeaeformis.AAC.24
MTLGISTRPSINADICVKYPEFTEHQPSTRGQKMFWLMPRDISFFGVVVCGVELIIIIISVPTAQPSC